MNTAANDSISINFDNIWITESDEFVTNANLKTWKVIAGSLGPFEFSLLETRL